MGRAGSRPAGIVWSSSGRSEVGLGCRKGGGCRRREGGRERAQGLYSLVHAGQPKNNQKNQKSMVVVHASQAMVLPGVVCAATVVVGAHLWALILVYTHTHTHTSFCCQPATWWFLNHYWETLGFTPHGRGAAPDRHMVTRKNVFCILYCMYFVPVYILQRGTLLPELTGPSLLPDERWESRSQQPCRLFARSCDDSQQRGPAQ